MNETGLRSAVSTFHPNSIWQSEIYILFPVIIMQSTEFPEAAHKISERAKLKLDCMFLSLSLSSLQNSFWRTREIRNIINNINLLHMEVSH